LVESGADILGGELGELLPSETGDEVETDAGGVAGVGVLAEPVDGDGLEPVRQVCGYAALRGRCRDALVLEAIFSVSLANASFRVVP
jgi:hypothetical protein